MTFSVPEAGPADGSVHPLSAHPNPRKEAPEPADSFYKAGTDTPNTGSSLSTS